MASPPDWLEGLSGGLLGITKGLELGMAPYRAYEGVRTQSLGNDKSDVELRDLLAAQAARENPDLNFYGNRFAALDATNRETLSKGNANIYGIDQALAANQYLGSEGFQQEVARLDPSDPEYRSKVAAAIAQYNPQAGITAYDAFKVPDVEQRNLTRQAVLSYAQAYARTKDPGATAEWATDGTITVTASDGEVVRGLNPDIILRAAAMASSKDPSAPIRADIATQSNVQRTNADLLRAVQTGQATPAQTVQYLNSVRVGYQNLYNRALAKEQALLKTQDYQMADDETKTEMRDTAKKETDRALKDLQRSIQHMQQMGKVATADAETLAAGEAGAAVPGVAPTGGPALTALPFGPRGAGAARAAGGGMGPWGESAAGPAYPTKAAATMNNIESVVQAILNGAR